MGEWNPPEDAGGPVEYLDPVFKNGNAPRFHGMVKRLAETEGTSMLGNCPPDPIYADIWGIDVLGPDDGEVRAGQVIESSGWNEYSILAGSARKNPEPDLTVEQFFYHADVLSGQDIGVARGHHNQIRTGVEIESGGWAADAIDRIQTARAWVPGRPADDPGTSFTIWTDLLNHLGYNSSFWTDKWTGDASVAAQDSFEALRRWYGEDVEDHFRSWGLGQLAKTLAAFAAVIHGARLNLDNLMGACVEQVKAWNRGEEQSPFADTGVAWAALSAVVGLAGKQVGRFDVPGLTLDLLNLLFAEMESSKKLNANGCYTILANYLTEADKILDEASKAASGLVDDVHTIRSSFTRLPE